MAIIIGDVHGHVEKVRAFLEYKPEEEHIALGDYVDSFYEPQGRQLLALQLLLDSKTVMLWGNHDLHYLFPIAPFISTGFQSGKEDAYFDVITAHKDRFLAAYAVDGWLLTHAGCHIRLAKHKTDAVQIAGMLNKKMTEYLAHPSVRPEGIFAIGLGRGGNNRIGGIFWYDFKRETGLAPVKQIFGHTETKEGPVVTENYICLDTTNNKSTCWFYDTAVNELVEVLLPRRNALISDLPEEEQAPFRKFLFGQTIPEADGYYEEDYRRWTRLKLLGLVDE